MQDFSPDRLRRLLILAKQRNAFIRHDVDYDPECALRMAVLEYELGIQATYYVRLRSESYNLLAPRLAQIMAKLHKYGHRVGMHVDLQLPRDAQVSLETLAVACALDYSLAVQEYDWISEHVSFHAPPRDVYWRDVQGFEHAMGRAWEGRYLADSRGVWKRSPERFLSQTDGIVQLGLHPEWWYWPEEVAVMARAREAVAP